MNRRAFLLTAVELVGIAGCTSMSPVSPLANGSSSAEGLASLILDALDRADRTGLEALALTEREFRDHVWPDLPASRPERNLPFSYVWEDLHQKSASQLSDTLRRHSGKKYQLRAVRFGGETRYSQSVVHRDSSFDIFDAAGAAHALKLCGSFIEKDGEWKVFSYVVDD